MDDPPFRPDYFTSPSRLPTGRATAGLVLGILSLALLPLWPVAILVAGAAVSVSGRARSAARQGTGGGAGLARAGLVCGTVSLLLILAVFWFFPHRDVLPAVTPGRPVARPAASGPA